MRPLYRGWIRVAALIADSDSFLLAALGPNCIRAYPVLMDGGLVVRALSGKPTVAHARVRGH